MAIEKTDYGFEVECDGEQCSESFSVESPSHEWVDFLNEMRAKGWRSLKEVDEQFVHLCPHCRDEYE
jgi:hypothetical protein